MGVFQQPVGGIIINKPIPFVNEYYYNLLPFFPYSAKLSALTDCVVIPICHCERPKGACLHAEVRVSVRRRGNLFIFTPREIASVVSLPRNDITTQSLKRKKLPVKSL